MSRISLVLVVLAGLLAGLPARAVPAPPHADDGARVVAERYVAERTLDLTVSSPALGGEVMTRLLLPPGWEARPHRRWPVLHLLHGCCGDYTSWTEFSDVEEISRRTGALIVMPEAGRAGFYSDWWNGGAGGTPAWETFHLTELRQILERGYGAGQRRAVAGLSMGGFGALSYAARHPGTFRAAAAYSGVVHTTLDRTSSDLVRGLVASTGADPDALWGDPVAQADVWRAHNPHDLASRLRGTRLYVSSGDGEPGPLDPPGTAHDGLEALLAAQNEAVVRRLGELRVPVTADLYGPGTHTWPYWDRALKRSFPLLMSAIGARVTG
ncbi:alpha/beta hydrolase [Umezawaea beigongshangensis]|uniref:alpha/beta hydrolase n=1 Tax=Umezawaea beigongshangensis TaxID=2780383 RepID=UPI0018F20E7E|nr:alpha/beta hydrolase family protein [Umezawaea beigongshangensis]